MGDPGEPFGGLEYRSSRADGFATRRRADVVESRSRPIASGAPTRRWTARHFMASPSRLRSTERATPDAPGHDAQAPCASHGALLASHVSTAQAGAAGAF